MSNSVTKPFYQLTIVLVQSQTLFGRLGLTASRGKKGPEEASTNKKWNLSRGNLCGKACQNKLTTKTSKAYEICFKSHLCILVIISKTLMTVDLQQILFFSP